MSLGENPDVAEYVIRDNRKSPNLKRAALVRLFGTGMDKKTCVVSVADISKIFLETETSHVKNYFYYTKIPENIIDRFSLEALLMTNKKETSEDKPKKREPNEFWFDESYSSRLALSLKDSTGQPSISDIVDKVKIKEKELLTNDKTLESSYSILKNYCENSLTVLSQKYAENFDEIRKEKDAFIQSLKTHKPRLSVTMKLVSRVPPFAGSGEMLRLGLDAWAYAMYDLLLGTLLAKKLNLNYNQDRKIMEETLDIIMNSQDEDGYWSVGKYDIAFQAIDTALMLEIIGMMKLCYPEIVIDRSAISKTSDFLRSCLKTVDSGDAKLSFSEVKNDIWRQNTLLSTCAVLHGLYKTNLILGNKREEIFNDQLFCQTLRYLVQLKSETGGFVKQGKFTEVETTALVTKLLLGKYNMKMNPDEIFGYTGIPFEPVKTIGYLQSSWKTLTEYLSQDHLNVTADAMHAALCCGVWPASSHMLEMLVEVSNLAQNHVSLIHDLDLVKLLKNKAGLRVLSNYQKIIKVIGTTHEVLFCIDIIDDYVKNPDSYWNRMFTLLTS